MLVFESMQGSSSPDSGVSGPPVPSPPDQPEMPTKAKFKNMVDQLCVGKTIIYMEELSDNAVYYGSEADECIVGTAKDDIIFGGGGECGASDIVCILLCQVNWVLNIFFFSLFPSPRRCGCKNRTLFGLSIMRWTMATTFSRE